MKIKTVCDITGLTDRTIRYYIEEQLISPTYTENYLGRKSFDFSQDNVDTLKNISVLRNFDFTIDEIRRIIIDANTSISIISNVRHRTEESVCEGKEKLLILSKLSNEKAYSIDQLAKELSKPTVSMIKHKEIIEWNPIKTILAFIKSVIIFAIVWLPVALSLFVVIISISDFHYPVFNYTMIGLTLASFWPSISVLIVSKSKWKRKKIVKRVLLILCALSIPISFIMSFGIITRSETSDIRNYRRLDADCLANRNSFFQDLFPVWPHYFVNEKQPDGSWETVYLDTHYYYRYLRVLDYTYDIYAEWPLEKEEFDKEVARVKELYDTKAKDYQTVQKGSFTCFFKYYGDPPFQEVTDNYTYYIFAYDETNQIVRYILCDSLENGVDKPFYLSLDW